MRASQIIGMNVVAGGNVAGTVIDMSFMKDMKAVSGLIVRKNLSFSRFLPAEEIDAIDGAKIISATPPITKKPVYRPVWVFNEDGVRLGRIVDIAFDPQTMRVNSLLVSRGVFDDIKDGRIWMNDFTTMPNGSVRVFDLSTLKPEG